MSLATAWSHFPQEAAVLLLALIIDVAAGEYPRRLHPVVWMGHVISGCERIAPKSGPARQLVFGAAMTLVVPLLFTAGAMGLLQAMKVPPVLHLVVSALLLKAAFALSALGQAAAVVRRALAEGRIDGARAGLRGLCSRDPGRLQPPALVAATVESVAENACDSFVAPLFYYTLFGVPGAFFYRAVNTLDAMIGYRGKHEYLGKAAARLDDVLNFVPARLTAAALLVAGALRGLDLRQGLRILRRDAARTASPNAGRPMAAMAGLLRVELAKEGHYHLGDPHDALDPVKINDAWRTVAAAGAVAAATFVAWLVIWSRHLR